MDDFDEAAGNEGNFASVGNSHLQQQHQLRAPQGGMDIDMGMSVVGFNSCMA